MVTLSIAFEEEEIYHVQTGSNQHHCQLSPDLITEILSIVKETKNASLLKALVHAVRGTVSSAINDLRKEIEKNVGVPGVSVDDLIRDANAIPIAAEMNSGPLDTVVGTIDKLPNTAVPLEVRNPSSAIDAVSDILTNIAQGVTKGISMNANVAVNE